MTQNTEQNVRTREEQIARYFWPEETETLISIEHYEAELIEAEARGAEEQRRKDAEGQFQTLNENGEWTSVSRDEHLHAPDEGRRIVPANVAGIDVDAVIRNVSELPDRTSPEGQPDLLMVTADELRLILSEAQPANVPALEARIAELTESEQLARADAEASKARVKVLEQGIARIEKQANEYPGDDAGALGWISSECDALTREGGV